MVIQSIVKVIKLFLLQILVVKFNLKEEVDLRNTEKPLKEVKDGRIITPPKQMKSGCRRWTGTLSVPLQGGITRNTKGVIICQRWVLLEIVFTKKD